MIRLCRSRRPAPEGLAAPHPGLASLAALLVGTMLVVGAPMTGAAQSESLRPLADDAGISLGAAVGAEDLADAASRELLVDQVNLLSSRGDLSMAVIQPEPGTFEFSEAEAIVDFAVEHDMRVRGHELITGDVPAWISTGSWSAESLGDVLREHVTTVIEHFRERNPGVIIQWDVVGDAFLPDGTLRPTIWQQVIGDDHLRIAFDAARAADPDALLFYDDFYDDLAVTQDAVASGTAIVGGANAQSTTCDAVAKCVGLRDRIATLVADGAPIDGIGFQAHLFSPDPADFSQLTEWIGGLGLQWAVTEFDVPLPVTEIDNPESLAFQAAVYGDALAACVDASNCDTFVTWGVSDRFSPIPAETGGAFGGALWFDADDLAKPAFDAMAAVLVDNAAPSTTLPATTAPEVTAPATTIAPASGSTSDGNAIVPIALGIGALVLVAGAVVIGLRRRRTPTAGHDAKNP